ncbi:hypothetical protein N0V86_003189 [Didymella sp. IMI 355093]|nr:hypothetical protein N0V86_003189 [Didymella sp. IMI 355093]
MYSDVFALTSAQKRRVEAELGKLESKTSLVLQEVFPACDDGKDTVPLTSHEEFIVKKFIFNTKYPDDKHKLLPYMNKHDLQRPIDVWLDNLMKILTTQAKNTDRCITKLYDNMYPTDATWVDMHMRLNHPVFCVPVEDEDEFFLLEVNSLPLMLPSEATSLFHNLSIYKLRAAYSKYETGFVSSKSKKSSGGLTNVLNFPIARIDSTTTQNINASVLNETYDPARVFKQTLPIFYSVEILVLKGQDQWV